MFVKFYVVCARTACSQNYQNVYFILHLLNFLDLLYRVLVLVWLRTKLNLLLVGPFLPKFVISKVFWDSLIFIENLFVRFLL